MAVPASSKYGAQFVKDVTIEDGTIVAPNQIIRKVWKIKNSGKASWPKGTKLVSLPGSTFGADAEVEIKEEVAPGSTFELAAVIKAPRNVGKHMAKYQLALPTGETFGHKYWANIQVSKFPNVKQLKAMAREFLGEPKVVKILQSELPYIIAEVRQGKSLATIVDLLLKKYPEMSEHSFVAFIRPFLSNAERFMSFQLKALLGMYSLFAMTPFANMCPFSAEAKQHAANVDVKHNVAEKPKKTSPPAKKPMEKKTTKAGWGAVTKKLAEEKKAAEKKAAEAKAKLVEELDNFKYKDAVEDIMKMGFKNRDVVMKLCAKHSGNVQQALNDLFST